MPGSELQHKLFAQNLVEAARAGQVLQKGRGGRSCGCGKYLHGTRQVSIRVCHMINSSVNNLDKISRVTKHLQWKTEQ